jgi:hypothetical protein
MTTRIVSVDHRGRLWSLEGGIWTSEETAEAYTEAEFAYEFPDARIDVPGRGGYGIQHGAGSNAEKRSSSSQSHGSVRKPKSQQHYQQYNDQGMVTKS